MNLKNKNILLAVTGGIAAYKACEILRALQKNGAKVTVLMTQAAKKFVGELTFEALSQKPVYIDMLDGAEKGIAHIDLVKKHDCMLVAPATADSIAKFRWGRADDLLSAVFLAFNKPKFIAPAMNTRMWNNPQTLSNMDSLKQQGVEFIDPQSGELACKDEGMGKLADESSILNAVLEFYGKKDSLKGKKVLITAGPTREYIDPVRFISAPSSGIMGYAIAKEASLRGAEVILVSGPVAIKADFKASMIHVDSANDMFEACKNYMDYDYMIATAAVADYVPTQKSTEKIKKKDETQTIKLQPSQDIARYLGDHKNKDQVLIAFAAETQNLKKNAQKKMQIKNADAIVANLVDETKKGFGNLKTDVQFLSACSNRLDKTLSNISKNDVAAELWQWLLDDAEV